MVHLPFLRARQARFAMTLAVLAALGVGVCRADPVDPLLRPAELSERAMASVLLAVTQAGDRLVAVGERGVILYSDDGGKRWTQAAVPVSVTLTGVSFANASLGWVVGHAGVVLHTGDGGKTWVRQLDGVQSAQVEVDAAARNAGTQAAGEAGARRVRESKRLADEGADKPLLDVHFWSPDDGMVVGAYGAILVTMDGGKSWSARRYAIDNPKGKHLYRIHAANGQIFIAGEQGSLFRTADHGNSFETVMSPYAGTFFGMVSSRASGLIAYGLRGNAFRSKDDGKTWEKLDLGQPITLTSGVGLADGSIVLVDESGRILRNAPGESRFSPVPIDQPYPFTGAVLSRDGALVLTGVRGATRIPPNSY